MSAKLIVTIDTEEEGLWSGQFGATGNPVTNVAGVPRFQQMCDELGVKPTYLVNSPVITDTSAAGCLREIHDAGSCEIGAHIHPWNTPPLSGDYNAYDSYLCNLPPDTQREKLRMVTEQIRDVFGFSPTSFRSGRYGLDRHGAGVLAELGYTVDSSVCPFTDYSADGGPDFRGAPFRPYWVGEDIVTPGEAGELLEVPVSFGFNRAGFELAFRVHEYLQGALTRRLHIIGVMDRLRILQKIKFSPEKGDAARLIRLVRAYARNAAPCMVMMFHSSSLRPGNTPYVRSEQQLDAFLATLRTTFEFCLSEMHMQAATLSQFANDYRSRKGASL